MKVRCTGCSTTYNISPLTCKKCGDKIPISSEPSCSIDDRSGVKFITTKEITFRLEQLIKKAKFEIILIAPYIKLDYGIKELLAEKRRDGVSILFICRTDDLKEPLGHYSTLIKNKKNLHAKCYFSENEAVISSLNLYDFSQINNDEMGFYVNKSSNAVLYADISKEVRRLVNNSTEVTNNNPAPITTRSATAIFIIGQKYSSKEIKSLLTFNNDFVAGINKSINGEIVLFSNTGSPYPLVENDGILYYQGQNTGGSVQKLIYGNLDLWNAYKNESDNIFLFVDYVYKGQFAICIEPYLNDGRYIFPLKIKS